MSEVSRSEHGVALNQGVPNAPTCVDCHAAHRILPHTDPAAPTSVKNLPQLCGECHEEEARLQAASLHGQAAARGDEMAPSCAECHGVRADGRGEKAALFQPPPPELTRLARRGGVEPRRESLMLVIDGRRIAKGHGERGMPVWGDRLLADATDSGLVEDARLHLIQSLADYLVSIQRSD